MSVEGDLFTVLKALVGTDVIAGFPSGRPRVFPDVAPVGVGLPYITYQQVGGDGLNFLSGVPSKRNGRFQINVWGAERLGVSALMRQVEDAVRLSAVLNAVTEGGAVAVYEKEDGSPALYGSRQDFSIWFNA